MNSMHIYDNSSLNSSYNDKCVRQNCREYQDAHFMYNNDLPKIVPFIIWKTFCRIGLATMILDYGAFAFHAR